MPPLNLPDLYHRLMEIGPVDFAGMDRVPLRHGTIGEWARSMGVALAPWEVRLLRRLSAEWLAESRKAVEVDCPPPWVTQNTATNRDVINRQLEAFFG